MDGLEEQKDGISVLTCFVVNVFLLSFQAFLLVFDLLRKRPCSEEVWSLIEKHACSTCLNDGTPGLDGQKLEANSVNNCVCMSARERKDKPE